MNKVEQDIFVASKVWLKLRIIWKLLDFLYLFFKVIFNF